jgi:hypothetical protein
MMHVPFELRIGSNLFDDDSANPASLGIPCHMVADLENSRHCFGTTTSAFFFAVRPRRCFQKYRPPASPTTSLADPPTGREDCRKLCSCRVRLRARYLALGLKPIVQIVTVGPSALFVKFVGALLNLLLNRN